MLWGIWLNQSISGTKGTKGVINRNGNFDPNVVVTAVDNDVPTVDIGLLVGLCVALTLIVLLLALFILYAFVEQRFCFDTYTYPSEVSLKTRVGRDVAGTLRDGRQGVRSAARNVRDSTYAVVEASPSSVQGGRRFSFRRMAPQASGQEMREASSQVMKAPPLALPVQTAKPRVPGPMQQRQGNGSKGEEGPVRNPALPLPTVGTHEKPKPPFPGTFSGNYIAEEKARPKLRSVQIHGVQLKPVLPAQVGVERKCPPPELPIASKPKPTMTRPPASRQSFKQPSEKIHPPKLPLAAIRTPLRPHHLPRNQVLPAMPSSNKPNRNVLDR